MFELTTAQIGHCGELLVQLILLQRGIESARLSTDSGVDLIAYSPWKHEPLTVQVKTNLKPKRAGGKGKLSLDWWIDVMCPAQLACFVDLESQRVWVFKMPELMSMAQQESKGKYHLYMYTDVTHKPKKRFRLCFVDDFENYRLESRIKDLFGIANNNLSVLS